MRTRSRLAPHHAMRFLVTGATGKVGNAVASPPGRARRRGRCPGPDPAKAREAAPAGRRARRAATSPTRRRCARRWRGQTGSSTAWACSSSGFADPGIFDRVNAEGARNVIAAAREAGVRRAVHTSTFDVFHAATGGPCQRTALADYPKGTAYERSKQHAEELVLAEAAAGIEVVIVNPSSGVRPRAVAGRGPGSGYPRRHPPAPPGRPAGGHVAGPRQRRRGGPARRVRTRQARPALHPRRRLRDHAGDPLDCGRRSRAGMGPSDPARPACPGTGHAPARQRRA